MYQKNITFLILQNLQKSSSRLRITCTIEGSLCWENQLAVVAVLLADDNTVAIPHFLLHLSAMITSTVRFLKLMTFRKQLQHFF